MHKIKSEGISEGFEFRLHKVFELFWRLASGGRESLRCRTSETKIAGRSSLEIELEPQG